MSASDPLLAATQAAGHLRGLLVRQGVLVLAVTAAVAAGEPDRLTVYLHGLGGPNMLDKAFRCLSASPKVARVNTSEQTPSILIVTLRPLRIGNPAQ